MSETPTSAPTVVYEIEPSELTASGSAVLRDLGYRAGRLRDEVELLNRDVNDHHRTVRPYDLSERASSKARKSVETLLDELSTERGMAWRDVARVAGVSRSAVRKWRAGDTPSPESRTRLALAAAFLDLLEQFPIEDPVGWLEVPILPGYSATAFDVFEAGHLDLLLDYAGQPVTAIEVLDVLDTSWRERFSSTFEVFTAPDGERSIRPKK